MWWHIIADKLSASRFRARPPSSAPGLAANSFHQQIAPFIKRFVFTFSRAKRE
jgi:hypothetical protein